MNDINSVTDMAEDITWWTNIKELDLDIVCQQNVFVLYFLSFPFLSLPFFFQFFFHSFFFSVLLLGAFHSFLLRVSLTAGSIY